MTQPPFASFATAPASLPPAILLMGPTAAGKTELACELAARLPCDLISVDSALVYRGMDIGAAKPSPRELARFPHRLVNIRDPAEVYSAACFRADALAAMAEIRAAGRIPLLVGGTMLYFRVLQQGLSELPEANPALRRRLEQEMALRGLPWMHQRLAAADPAAAARIHPNDPQRILRALEVWELTGRPLSAQQLGVGEVLPYRLVKLARAPADRAVLHERIARRFRAMLAKGLIEEVRGLLARGDLSPATPALRAVGYRQVVQYLLGELSYEQMVEKGIVATRQLAKRQLTWLRAEPDLHWLDEAAGDPCGQALRLIEARLGVAPPAPRPPAPI